MYIDDSPVIVGSTVIAIGSGCILIRCGVPLARSARHPIPPQSDLSLLDDTNTTSVRYMFDVDIPVLRTDTAKVDPHYRFQQEDSKIEFSSHSKATDNLLRISYIRDKC